MPLDYTSECNDKYEQLAYVLGCTPILNSVGVCVRLCERVYDVGATPFTCPDSPSSDDPQRNCEDKKHGAWADGHKGLHDKACVEIDLVEGTDAA